MFTGAQENSLDYLEEEWGMGSLPDIIGLLLPWFLTTGCASYNPNYVLDGHMFLSMVYCVTKLAWQDWVRRINLKSPMTLNWNRAKCPPFKKYSWNNVINSMSSLKETWFCFLLCLLLKRVRQLSLNNVTCGPFAVTGIMTNHIEDWSVWYVPLKWKIVLKRVEDDILDSLLHVMHGKYILSSAPAHRRYCSHCSFCLFRSFFQLYHVYRFANLQIGTEFFEITVRTGFDVLYKYRTTGLQWKTLRS